MQGVYRELVVTMLPVNAVSSMQRHQSAILGNNSHAESPTTWSCDVLAWLEQTASCFVTA